MNSETQKSKVALLKTSPNKASDTYREIMHLAEYQKFISRDIDTLCAQIYPRSPR